MQGVGIYGETQCRCGQWLISTSATFWQLRRLHGMSNALVSSPQSQHLFEGLAHCVTGSGASAEFKEVSYEVQSLHAASAVVPDKLADLDASLTDTLPRQRSKLQGNCAASLKQLEDAVQKYGSLRQTSVVTFH